MLNSSYPHTLRSVTEESNKKDVVFFKLCIVNYYGFTVRSQKITKVPKIDESHFLVNNKHLHMSYIAKRVERFFIRNGNWYKLLEKKEIFNPKSRDCRNLLYIIAAKYVYALYVLNTVADHSTIVHCKERRRWNKYVYSLTSRESVCYIKPTILSCAEEIELNLLGHKSGSLTALFNQFFREPIGEDPTVPGFKDDPDIVLGVRVSAFHLEYAYLRVFKGPDFFYNMGLLVAINQMRKSRNMKLLSIIVAIYRMKSYSAKYFNELLSDQSPMRVNRVLAREFQYWSVELASFESKITNFMKSPHYSYDLNYRRRHNIAFELVTGRLENSGKNELLTTFKEFNC